MRINKYLAQSGIASRRKCDELISGKKIKINGSVVTDFSYQVKFDDIVMYKNKLVELVTEYKYYMLHKPKGYICSNIDPQKRKTIYSLLPQDSRIFSVGRLDYDTTGLIFLTNDGDFSNFLCHPKNKILKKYHVETKSKINQKQINVVKKGILLSKKEKVKGDIYYKKYIKQKYHWDVFLTEGKNREIKRIFDYFNVEVSLIHRYEFAGIELGDIKVGKYKFLANKTIKELKNKYGYKK